MGAETGLWVYFSPHLAVVRPGIRLPISTVATEPYDLLLFFKHNLKPLFERWRSRITTGGGGPSSVADAPEYLSLVIAFTVSWLLFSLMVTTLTTPDFFRFQVQGQNEWIHADFVLLRVHGHGKLQGMSCSLRLVGNRGF